MSSTCFEHKGSSLGSSLLDQQVCFYWSM